MIVSTMRNGNTLITSGDDQVELTKDEVETVVKVATGMITVKYQIHVDDYHSRGEVDLPSWAEAEPQTAVALYFFGTTRLTGTIHAEVVADAPTQAETPLLNRFGQKIDADGELLTIED